MTGKVLDESNRTGMRLRIMPPSRRQCLEQEKSGNFVYVEWPTSTSESVVNTTNAKHVNAQTVDDIDVFIHGACEPKNPGGVPTYAIVIYRYSRKIFAEAGLAGEPYSDDATNNVAEYTAYTKALEKIKELGFSHANVKIFAESNLLVNQVKCNWKAKKPQIILLHQKAMELTKQIQRITVNRISKDENLELDELSKEAYYRYLRKARLRQDRM